MKELQKDLASMIENSSMECKVRDTLDKIDMAKKTGNRVSFFEKEVKRIKDFLQEYQERIKELQK